MTSTSDSNIWEPDLIQIIRGMLGRADKSLARPVRKQATGTKLGIYSTYSPRSSIYFLACCFNFCKPLKNNFRKLSVQPGLRGSNDLRVGRKMSTFQLFFSVHGTGGCPTGPDLENRVGDHENGSPGRPVSSGFQVPGEPGHCRVRTRPPWWTSRGVFTSELPSIAPADLSNTPRCYFGPLKNNQWGGCRLDPKKSRREFFQRIFAVRIFWGRGEPLCRHSIDCCFVSGS